MAAPGQTVPATGPLFGLVAAGHPVIVDPTEMPSATSFLYSIPTTMPGSAAASPKAFSHIVVFLLPGIQLPPGTAASIYLVTPPTAPGQAPGTKFLGAVGPGKESAIFKLSAGAGGSGANTVIGVMIQPAEQVTAQMAQLSQEAAVGSPGTGTSMSTAVVPAARGVGGGPGAVNPVTTVVLAQRIIKSAFNFLASFSQPAGEVEVVPLKAFEAWWKRFEARVQADPSFLERED